MIECRTYDGTNRAFCKKEECIWFATYVTELILIVLINTFTLATFARNRHLRKRSTYLIINLTVADLLLGAEEGLLSILEPAILERYLSCSSEEGFRWQKLILLTLNLLFPVASLVYILLISLERLHATIYPFRHCLIGERVYLRLTACSWFFSLLLAFVFALLALRSSLFQYVLVSYVAVTLLILSVSYIVIILSVKNNPHSHNFRSALLAERKISVTLFTVTVVCFLTILPGVSWDVILYHRFSKLSPAITYPISYTFDALYLLYPIVNPLVYAIRMQEFRKATKKLVCKKT